MSYAFTRDGPAGEHHYAEVRAAIGGAAPEGLVVHSQIPTTTVVRNSSTVKSLNPVLAIISETRLVPRPAGTPSYPALSTAIYTNVNAALAGSTSPSAAMAAAQSQANTTLSSVPSGP